MKSLQYLLIVFWCLHSNVLLSTCADWDAFFNPNKTLLEIDATEEFHLILSNLSDETIQSINSNFVLRTRNPQVAVVDNPDEIEFFEVVGENGSWEAHFRVRGVFLGSTQFLVEKLENGNEVIEQSNEFLEVIVLRPERLVDTMFAVVVVLLLAVSFINFGAAMDIKTMKQIYRRPVGPAIGTVCQLVFMPLLGYGLGIAIFPDNPELALGLFLTGISPAGGASNIWTLLCGGNITLSISMTTISTIACFGTMPMWLYLLGRKVFDRANIGVPYVQVTLLAISLLVPLGVGLLIQKFLPRVAAFLVRIIKIMSLIFIIIIVIFGIFTNLYMMPLFAWQIVVAGFSLPLLGNTIGFIGGKIFKQSNEDCIAIAIEVGVQNSALTLFLLTFALEPPASDISMIIPIAISICTPVPMILFIIIKKITEYLAKRKATDLITGSPEVEKAPI